MTLSFPQRLTPEVWAMIDEGRRLGPMDQATYQAVVGGYAPRDRRAYLMLLHPDESPGPAGEPFGCMNPPSRFRSDAKWRRFRETCLIPMIEADPANPNWPRYLTQVDAILAWRASIPAEDRFWKPDEPSELWPLR